MCTDKIGFNLLPSYKLVFKKQQYGKW